MKVAKGWVVLWLGVVCMSPVWAQTPTGDERILAAREALRTGDQATLDQLAAGRSPHLLERYVKCWHLQNQLARSEPPDTARIEAFLARYAGSVLADRLRGAWLNRLAKDENWIGFIGAWGGLASPTDGQRCQHWLARARIGDRTALDEAAAVWAGLSLRAEACEALVGQLAASGRLAPEAIWARFREQMMSRRPSDLELIVSGLPAGEAPTSAALKVMVKDPARYLDNLRPGFAQRRADSELMLAALGRLAVGDPKAAYARFARLNDGLSADDQAYGYMLLGWRAAQDHLPESVRWFRAAGKLQMPDEQRAWQVRAALRQEDWKAVRHAILAMSPEQRAERSWTYWLARAEQALGEAEGGRLLLERIAGHPDFYGMLADERLGRAFTPPPPDTPQTAAVQADVAADPDIRRALALYRLALYTEGTREWLWRLRSADDSFRLAAARLALDEGIYDRAINTAEAVNPQDNFGLRYLTPFRDLIEPQALSLNLDLAWVYGVLRQESRFVTRAASPVGAQGLMQVMPATGSWVAKKIGMTDYRRSRLQEPDTNVLLGTSYMRIVLDDLDDHPVLAAAGYNAGPGRAKRWRDERMLEGAIYVETIPFNETRDYVKKVMANAVIYAALMEGKPQSLTTRLGQVAPR
ncbi:lytic transglycosylase domain-containing protein [Denitromonas ohlonensis]|uniref:Lytic transglycosylase domain-containing protein n=2 Tax=Denitromonas TaxID=139331 RepID=A0A557RII2_9RHOO|nr:lytic transglycosylase domain-containing protein [Denitromonas ohlonensis]TVO64959.1 lytic transglycosylase domain-containing protein [Denitromonas ohlonensis]TVO75632.1 lytic transglycosylase domain-containing protein [Denitromonas ohlonensis]